MHLLEKIVFNEDNDITKILDVALQQIFTQEYYQKISSSLKKTIHIKSVRSGGDFGAYTQGNTIVVNADVFHESNFEEQISYLLHEFMHILQKQSHLMKKVFPEFIQLSKTIFTLVKQDLKNKPISIFLVGEPKQMKTANWEEVIAYMMNDKINWNVLSNETRQQIYAVLQRSNVFHLKTLYWKKRIHRMLDFKSR